MEARNPSNDPLEDVAAAIAEGRPVDWDAARAVSGPSPALQKFELLQGIAQAFRKENEAMAPVLPEQPESASPSGATGGSPEHRSAGSAKTVSSESSTTAPRPRTQFTWGPLLVLEEIGAGAFATVYRAYDHTLDREVALKLRRADAPQDERTINRFIDEARKLARIQHPHVVKVHGADVHDGRVGIWEDLVRGRTFSDIVKHHGPYGADEAIIIGMDLCCALASLHVNNLVHRDIKPSNVMREQGGHIVLMDFGSAGDIKGAPAASHRPFSGTPLTAAPEVLVGGELPTPASDIYSLGVLLYWLVSGRYPVEADGISRLVQMHKSGAVRPLLDVRPDVPRAFAHVVERALARDPQQRFASTGEMQHALAAALVVRTPPRFSLRAWLAAHRRAVVAGTLAAAVAGAAFGFLRWFLAPLQVDATLYRVRGGVTEPLSPGGRVQGGDQIFLELRGGKKMYAWVVNEDTQGTAHVLFPVGPEQTPALQRGRAYRLPFEGETEMNWQIDSEGATETLLVAASPRRLAGFAERVAAARGIDLAPVPAKDRTRPLAKLAEQLRDERGVWVQIIVLTKDAAPRNGAALP